MSSLGLINGRVLSGRKFINNCSVLIINNKIVEITSEEIKADRIIDCKNKVIASGYIDTHTHGGYLCDVMQATRESIDTIARYHLETGITTFYPTTLTAPTNSLILAVDNIRQAMIDNSYARIGGIHLEGPYFTPYNAGAQPPKYLVRPTISNTKFIFENSDIIKRISIAPDVVGISEYVEKFSQAGLQVSGGHDNAVASEIYPCIENGMTSVTHLFNCTSKDTRRPLPHKQAGLTNIGLADDRLYVEIIADNRHTPFPEFTVAMRCKGAEKIVLVSDSLSVAGMGKIKHYLGKQGEGYVIEVLDDVAILPELNTYAGSVTPISKMVRLILSKYDLPAEDIICMATINPATMMGLKDRGDIKVGMLADINIMNDKYEIEQTILNGMIIPNSK